MPEISATDLAMLKKNQALLESLVSDPKQGLGIQRILKEKDPTLKFAALDIEATVSEPIKAELAETKSTLQKLQEEWTADQAARKTEKETNALREAIGKTVAKHKMTEETAQKFVTFMADNNVSNPDIAAPAFLDTLPKPPTPQAPSPYLPQYVTPFGTGDAAGDDPDTAFLHNDPRKWQDAMTLRILNEAEAA